MAAPFTHDHSLPVLPPVRLYRHALESVFAFFELRELPTLLVVSREWQSAVLSMKPLDATVNIANLPLYDQCLSSPLRRHIRRLTCYSFVMPLSALNRLSVRLPQLAELYVVLAEAADAAPLIFPAKLRVLEFRVQTRPEKRKEDLTTAVFTRTMNAIGFLTQLTVLLIYGEFPVGASLSALTHLPQLRSLTLSCRGFERSDARIAELRSFGDLEYVHLCAADPLLWSRVLAQPHSLRWKELHGFGVLTEPIMQLLVALPLKKCNAYFAIPHIDQLAQLKDLTDLSLHSSCRVPLDRSRIFHTLASLVQLRSLALSDSSDDNDLHFTDAHLAELLPPLTQLRSLSIDAATQLTSLSFLTRGILPRTLTDLSLESFTPRVPVAELKHVLPLTNLESLNLSDVFDAPIDEADELLFKPPMRARTFPHLQSFEHSWSCPSSSD